MSEAIVASELASKAYEEVGGAKGVALLVLFLVAVIIIIGLSIAVAIFVANQKNTNFPLTDGSYLIRLVNETTNFQPCTTCYTSPADCVTLGAAISSGTSSVSLSKSATLIPSGATLMKDTATERFYYLASNVQVCSNLDTQPNGLSDWFFTIIQTLSTSSAQVLINNGNSGKFLRKCTTSCQGSNGSSPVILCDLTKEQALSDPNANWILTRL